MEEEIKKKNEELKAPRKIEDTKNQENEIKKDLKESKDVRLTEYILIGTLMSFGLGILFAMLYKSIL